MTQEQQLTVPGRFESLAQISDFVITAARKAGLSEDDIFHVEMAVDEACSNVIEHAYARVQGNIELACAMPEPGCLMITIHDQGRPFDPESVPLPPMSGDATLDLIQEGGLGLYFMRKLMDEVSFSFTPGAGNTLMMTKRRKNTRP